MKVAVVSTGLGRILRGFEAFSESLFRELRRRAPGLEVTLFKGGGKAYEGEVVVPNLHRNDIPARWFGEYRGNHLEQRSFALSLYPRLRSGGYQIVHYNELVFGSALLHLRRRFGGRYRLLYCNGAPSPPCHYRHRCDAAQVLTQPMYEEALHSGLTRDSVFLVPYGLDHERFSYAGRRSRGAVRKELGIPEDARLVLCVAALKREHKRIDHIIREVAGLDRSVWFLAAGQSTGETPSLKQEADRLIPGRWKFVGWPHERVPLLYGAADAFVLASLTEGFGLVTIEAMLSGLPVLIHDSPVSRWLAEGSRARLLDMSEKGALQAGLRETLSGDTERTSREAALQRFSWEVLVPRYLSMYQAVANGKCPSAHKGSPAPAALVHHHGKI